MYRSQNRNTVEREFAKALTREMVRAEALPYRTVAYRLRVLERSYLARVRTKLLARELKRRVAEMLLHQAIFHGCSMNVCRQKLYALSELGFSNLERKGHFHLIYARGALARCHIRIAQAIARGMVAELDRLGGSRNALARSLTDAFADLLKKL